MEKSQISIPIKSYPQEESRGSDLNKSLHAKHMHITKDSIPIYLKKRLNRYKSIYETMHNRHNDDNYYPRNYHLRRNEIPDTDILTQLMQKRPRQDDKDFHKHYKQHNHSRSLRRFKMPSAAIMQKKLKIS